MIRRIGLDFGTTNTSLAVVDDRGQARLAGFGEPNHTFRSVLYFTAGEVYGRPEATAGPAAIADYLATDTPGRLVQSLKSYLADSRFTRTNVYGRTYRLEQMLELLLSNVRQAAETELGKLDAHVVVGRPVHFVSATCAEDDDLAIERLRAALQGAGFDDVSFLYEPVAAAYGYRQRLTDRELVLIADFGGGTTDLSLVELAPLSPRDDPSAGVTIVGTAGVAIAGDCFDGRMVQHAIAPAFGHDATYHSPMGRDLPVPAWPYMRLRRWQHVSFLKNPKTLELLAEVGRTASRPEAIAALAHVIENDLGFELHRSVQSSKLQLSREDRSELRFAHGPMPLETAIERSDFESWIQPDRDKIADCLATILQQSGADTNAIDAVFLTGGSSLVPSVRTLFADQFGREKLRGGDERWSSACREIRSRR